MDTDGGEGRGVNRRWAQIDADEGGSEDDVENEDDYERVGEIERLGSPPYVGGYAMREYFLNFLIGRAGFRHNILCPNRN
jgi:hypothetical protein